MLLRYFCRDWVENRLSLSAGAAWRSEQGQISPANNWTLHSVPGDQETHWTLHSVPGDQETYWTLHRGTRRHNGHCIVFQGTRRHTGHYIVFKGTMRHIGHCIVFQERHLVRVASLITSPLSWDTDNTQHISVQRKVESREREWPGVGAGTGGQFYYCNASAMKGRSECSSPA